MYTYFSFPIILRAARPRNEQCVCLCHREAFWLLKGSDCSSTSLPGNRHSHVKLRRGKRQDQWRALVICQIHCKLQVLVWCSQEWRQILWLLTLLGVKLKKEFFSADTLSLLWCCAQQQGPDSHELFWKGGFSPKTSRCRCFSKWQVTASERTS